jgi:hypothetical protein
MDYVRRAKSQTQNVSLPGPKDRWVISIPAGLDVHDDLPGRCRRPGPPEPPEPSCPDQQDRQKDIPDHEDLRHAVRAPSRRLGLSRPHCNPRATG